MDTKGEIVGMQVTDRPLVDALAEFAVGVRFHRLPPEVAVATHHALLDTIAVVLAGASEPEIRALGAGLAAGSGSSEASLLGMSARADAATAALVNGTGGVWHDFDPGNRWLGGHPSAHVVPAVLAVAEREHASGRRALEAIIAGYEVAARIGAGVTLRPGMHPHGTWAVCGAAAAAAMLTQPSGADLVREAILISASLPLATSFPAAFAGASVRNVFAGLGAANAIRAVDMAMAGMTGPADALEDVYSRVVGVAFDAEHAGQVQEWMILRGFHKLRANARYVHPALDAMDEAIRRADGIGSEEIESITVRTFSFAASMNNPSPKSPLAARFSVPFGLATMVVRGETGVDAFGDQTLSDPAIRALSEKVQVHADPDADRGLPERRPASVSVRLRDGRVVEGHVEQSAGEPDGDSPVTDAELRGKFTALASRVLGPDGAQRLLQALDGVEAVADMSSIAALARA